MRVRSIHGLEELAKAYIEVGRDINEFRPDLLLVPLRGGYHVFVNAFAALGNNFNVSANDYSPFVEFSPIGVNTKVTIGRQFIQKLLAWYGRQDKVMVIDEVNSGESLRFILTTYEKELLDLANELRISCVATSHTILQDRTLGEYNGKVKLHRISQPNIPFTDKEELIGIESEESESYACINFAPYGFFDRRAPSVAVKQSEELYRQLQTAMSHHA